jgi:hypothetical protein
MDPAISLGQYQNLGRPEGPLDGTRHSRRDHAIMDFIAHWSERTEIRALQLVGWMGLSRSKFLLLARQIEFLPIRRAGMLCRTNTGVAFLAVDSSKLCVESTIYAA